MCQVGRIARQPDQLGIAMRQHAAQPQRLVASRSGRIGRQHAHQQRLAVERAEQKRLADLDAIERGGGARQQHGRAIGRHQQVGTVEQQPEG